MSAEVSRAGRAACCNVCGADDVRHMPGERGKKVYCNVCRHVQRLGDVFYPEFKTDDTRILRAVDWINGVTGAGVSRLDVARHLGISKNPRLIRIMEYFVTSGQFVKWEQPSPHNARRMKVYAPWVAEGTPQDARHAPQSDYEAIDLPLPPWRRVVGVGGRS